MFQYPAAGKVTQQSLCFHYVFVFTGAGPGQIAVIQVGSRRIKPEDEIMANVREALTEWMETDPTGDTVKRQFGDRFNIQDLAGLEQDLADSMDPFFDKHGVIALEFFYVGFGPEVGRALDFEAALVHPGRLTISREVRFRQIAERYRKKGLKVAEGSVDRKLLGPGEQASIHRYLLVLSSQPPGAAIFLTFESQAELSKWYGDEHVLESDDWFVGDGWDAEEVVDLDTGFLVQERSWINDEPERE